jgi:hypothetical protein
LYLLILWLQKNIKNAKINKPYLETIKTAA